MIYLRYFLGLCAGLVLALLLVIAVEYYSNLVHPFPEELLAKSPHEITTDEICMHVSNYPPWVLGTVLLLWGLVAAASCGLGGWIGGTFASLSVAAVLFLMLVINLLMLPYPEWFQLGMLVSFLTAAQLAVRWTRRRSSTRANPAT